MTEISASDQSIKKNVKTREALDQFATVWLGRGFHCALVLAAALVKLVRSIASALTAK